MARYILAATALPGHVSPLLAIAQHLVRQGHEVVFNTASLFREKAEATGARFVPFPGEIDFDYRRISELFPDYHEAERGPLKLMLGLRYLCRTMLGQKAGLDGILADFPADAILVDTVFAGTVPMLLGPREARPPVITIGITALAATSVDTPFFGSGMPPSTTSEGRARNIAMHRNMQAQCAGMQQEFDETLASIGCPPLPEFMFDAFVSLPDLYLQLTGESFEYPRSDLPETVRFVGPLLAPPTRSFTPPGWWGELDGGKPVVVATQGTFANEDFGQLIGPTLTALKDEDMLVVATTGGPAVEEIPVPIPANTRATPFVAYDRLLPKVDVFVTNGGYGSVNHALSLGVPIVVAGDTEEKPEIAARVAWTGAGINLGTGHPRPEQIRNAVRTVLSDPRYRRRAQAVQADFARHDARREIAAILDDLVSGQGQRRATA
ncbi:glycosyltransferase [Inquilinus limosus]|uniref:UDP-glucuronosyltransferase n=1 Tax=Inquilinus limosus MP06 TaxID=1398085 RepID=A0A0A0D5A2_9PROT|nr:nucleotide disphospho-sugar-binding domain-containing protein [Inquilinus limosus]KGM33008.1 UDP-glucuronosyltransferase [Inquilinus limosus MP06]